MPTPEFTVHFVKLFAIAPYVAVAIIVCAIAYTKLRLYR